MESNIFVVMHLEKAGNCDKMNKKTLGNGVKFKYEKIR